jgi:hypothetical protein
MAVSSRLERIAGTILWIVILGFGAGLLNSLISPGQRSSGVISFVFWYAVPVLVVLLSAWALRSTAERRVSVALFLLFGLGSAFLAEATLRAFPKRVDGFSITEAVADTLCPGEWRNQTGCLAAAVAGLPFDRRSKLEVINDLEAIGIATWPSIDASYYLDPANEIEVDGDIRIPLAPGIPDVHTLLCNESGSWVTYESDEYGFNNPVGNHRAGFANVGVVGDSFVHGWCVPYDRSLVGLMRENGSAALGVGLQGSGPLAQLGIVREYLAPLRPPVVIWVFFEGNDLRDLARELTNDLLLRYLEPAFTQGLRELTPSIQVHLREDISRLEAVESEKAEQARLHRETARRRRDSLGGWIRLTETRRRLKDIGRGRLPDRPFDAAAFDQITTRMRDDVASWGGTLVFAYLPSQRRFADTVAANPHRTDILARVRGQGIAVIDLYEAMSDHPDPLSLFPFRVENHLTAEGYDLLAATLSRAIQELQ